MKPISYRAVGEFRKHRKLKSGLAPTGVLRQNLVLHNSFQGPIYAAPSQKTNADQPFFPFIPWQTGLDSRSPMQTKNLLQMGRPSDHFPHHKTALRLQQSRQALIMITSCLNQE